MEKIKRTTKNDLAYDTCSRSTRHGSKLIIIIIIITWSNMERSAESRQRSPDMEESGRPMF